jgi:predicted Zn-dependent protease
VNENEQQLPTEARTALGKCFAHIRLARATELAQSGRFLEAEAVLVQNGELPEDPRALDLLARIAARQGRFSEARRRWEAAMRKDPANKGYVLCVERLTLPSQVCRFVARSQDTLLAVLVWATIALGVGALVLTFLCK